MDNIIRRNKATSSIVFLIIIINLLCLFPLTFRIYSRSSLSIIITYFIMIVFFLNRNIRILKKQMLVFGVMAVYSTVTLFFTKGGIGSLVNPLASMLFVMIINNCNFKERIFCYVKYLFYLLFFACIIRSPGYFINWSDKNTFSFNPNTLGFLLVYSSILINILGEEKPKRLKQIFTILLISLTFYGIFQYKSRASFIMYVAFLFFKYFIPSCWKRNKHFTISVYITILLMGILFPLFYLRLLECIVNVEFPLLQNFAMNKDLYSGREIIWSNFYTEMSKDISHYIIWIGSHANIMYGGDNINPHNIYILVMMNFGIIGFIIFFSFYILQIYKIYQKHNLNKKKIDFTYAAFSYLMLGIFEVTSLWSPFTVFMSLLWGIAGSTIVNNTRDENRKEGINL